MTIRTQDLAVMSDDAIADAVADKVEALADRFGSSCTLDMADRFGGMTLADVGDVMGVTKQRVRQIEQTGQDRFTRRVRLIRRVRASDFLAVVE